MTITLDIPDDIGAKLEAAGMDVARAALEGVALEGYRSRRLSQGDVRQLLGYGTPMEVHALLAAHDVDFYYPAEHVQLEIEASDKFIGQAVREASRAA